MTEKGLSRGGRGPRIRDEELEKMVALYLEGKTFQSIAKEVGRHWQTVRKYTLKTLREKEGKELRREAFKDAFSDHFKDLVGALDSFSELLQFPSRDWQVTTNNWQPPVQDRRNRLLFQALRDTHASESPLWSLRDNWNQTRTAYDKGLLPLQKKVAGELTKLNQAYPKASLELTDELSRMLLTRSVSIAQGSTLYDPSMLRANLPSGKEGESEVGELWLGQSTRLAIGQNMTGIQERLSSLMKNMVEWEQVKDLAKHYRRMLEIKDMIEEEVEVLSLRRAFPGHCRFCPI